MHKRSLIYKHTSSQSRPARERSKRKE